MVQKVCKGSFRYRMNSVGMWNSFQSIPQPQPQPPPPPPLDSLFAAAAKSPAASRRTLTADPTWLGRPGCFWPFGASRARIFSCRPRCRAPPGTAPTSSATRRTSRSRPRVADLRQPLVHALGLGLLEIEACPTVLCFFGIEVCVMDAVGTVFEIGYGDAVPDGHFCPSRGL